jgi:colanic acid/amylovoran biosynthesis protein
MVNTLREFFPKAEFTVFATEPALTAENVFDVKLFQSLGSRSGRKWRQLLNFIFFLRNWLWLYFRQKGINLFFLTSKKTREALYEYLDSDIVISCGGGYLNDNAGCAFLGCLFDVYLGVLIGKPTVLYGQSIGPFRNKRLKYIAKKVLDRVNLITLRDEISTEFLNDLGIRGPEVRVTADAALLLPMVEATLVRQILSSQGIEERTPLVTITVKPWYFPGFSDRERNKQKYLDALIKLSKHIVDRYRANVLFVPMDISNSPGNVQRHGLPEVLRRQAKKILGYNHKTVYSGEIDLLQKILNDTSNYPQVKLLKGKHTPSEIKAIINNSIVHVATRMHSSIYAACQGTPILGIAYEPKMVSFMKALGQEKFLTKIEDVEPDDLTSKFDCLWENRDQVSRTILERVKDLKSKAFLNAELVGQLLSLKH